MGGLLRGFGILAVAVGTGFALPTEGRTVSQDTRVSNRSSHQALMAQANSDKFEYKNVEFWVTQCLVLHEEQEYPKALQACEQAISLKPKPLDLAVWAARSDALFQLGRYAESIVSYTQIVNTAPKYSFAIARQCAASFQLGRYSDAADSCETALRIDGNWDKGSPAFAWYYRGLSLQKLGRLETALDSFEQALRINPEDSMAIAGRCGVLSELKRDEPSASQPQKPLGKNDQPFKPCGLQETASAYERALAISPNDAALWLQQGSSVEQLGAYERALTSYNRAVELNPKSSLALVRRCGILNQLEDYKGALESCEKAFQGDGRWGKFGLVYAWNQRSIAFLGLGQYKDALASADRAIALSSEYAPAWNSRAVSLWRLGQANDDEGTYQEAKESTIQATNLYEKTEKLLGNTFERDLPDPPILFYRGQILAWFNQGRILMSLKDYEQAANAYTQALNLYESAFGKGLKTLDAPILANIWANQGVAYLHFDLGQALKSTQAAIRYDKNSFAGWYNQGLVLTRLDDFSGALESFDRADRLKPNNVYVWTGRGMALQLSGRTQEAIAAFDQALNINPNYTLAQQYRNSLVKPNK